MNIISVNGRMESVNDIHDGIDIARDTMGEDWYSFMCQEISDIDATWDDLEREIESYRQSEQELTEEYQRYLVDVEDLIETALSKLSEMRSTTKLREVEKILAEARKICFENT